MLRYGALLAVAFAAAPANAQQMSAAEARHFVVGKHFAYQCFEGTRGAGRIAENGSVAGTIQFRGGGATRYAMLPANTLYVTGDRICATVKGVPFQPCFNLIKTSANSFRGSVSGLGFAYCDFVRRDRPVIASAAPRPIQPPAEARADAHSGDSHPETTAAVPAAPAPVETRELPKLEDKPAAAPAEDKPDLRSSKE
jgi:hypothetical protein